MQSLIDKIRKARQQTVEAGGFKFTIERPTDMQVIDLQQDNVRLRQSELLKRFIVGWEGVKETDIIPGGVGVEVEFDNDLFIEWIADKPNLWTPITDAITLSYQDHIKALGESEKKPVAG